ncbi:MAG: SDR family NAD(P)-dependent oxidoreductase, partial [Candidatus Electrothrix sp. MAN1_4]|nr:SDR family NAD(P)-dependent oxidoreductase [Candidatus Electrothrix sp. MAN1_4]
TCLGLEQAAATALAASLHLEHPEIRIRVLDFCPDTVDSDVISRIYTEICTSAAFYAAGYDAELKRRAPRPALRNPAEYLPRPISWSARDVFLVTGGAKGITAECAFAFAQKEKVQMILVGSSPLPLRDDQQSEIARTLERYSAVELPVQYYQCDITNAVAVKELIRQIQKEYGSITGVIHGSAQNSPRELQSTSLPDVLEEIAPKLLGLINLCTVLDDSPPKLFIAFSSIISVTGMMGNGWYGFSNEAMQFAMRQYAELFPQTAVLSIAFSIWDEVGMGMKMGSTTRLAKMGIDAIPVQEGVAHFLRLAAYDPGDNQVIVTARTAGLNTFTPPLPTIDGLRFLEKITNYYPGIELTSRAWLTHERDTYLEDHIWHGTSLFPLVFGL